MLFIGTGFTKRDTPFGLFAGQVICAAGSSSATASPWIATHY
ncbi:hypothetical protein ACPA9J_02050 [Pseudomonas aeruginosa]